MKIAYGLLLTALVIAGCNKGAPSLNGKWNLAMGPANLQIEFGENGQYSGVMNGPGMSGPATGTYRINGNVLELDPPTINGPNGPITPPSGTMKAKMNPKGPDMIELDAGSNKFMLTRIGP